MMYDPAGSDRVRPAPEHHGHFGLALAALVAALLLFASACGGATVDGASSGNGNGNTAGSAAQTTGTSMSAATDATCKSGALQAGEVGVTADTITVAVVADTGAAIRPGLFQGSVDGVKAWADYQNAKGGVGCRKIVVKDYDSKMSPGDTKNSLLSACSDAVALVGTTSLFLNDVSPIEQCPGMSGEAPGMPDIALTQTEPAHQCSAVSFAVLPTGGSCPYSGSGVRDFNVSTAATAYYVKTFGDDLHGTFGVPKDLPSTISAAMPGLRAAQEVGIKRDAEIGVSGLDTQSKYTAMVQDIKDKGSNYVQNAIDYKGTVFLRKEAQIQGVDSVKVWDCGLQCYDQRLITEGGSAVEGQNSWLGFLPFEDKGANPALDAFLQYDQKPDGWGMQAFAAGELFTQVVDEIVADKGPNAITRQNILEGLRATKGFTADGLLPPTDVGSKTPSSCFVLMQVKDGRFIRVDPTAPGTFDCTNPLHRLSLDPVAAFQG